MIRYWLSGEHDLVSAACCTPRSLRRLSTCGPWEAQHVGGRTSVTMLRGAAVEAWSDEQPGTGGLVYQLADPFPEFDPDVWVRKDATGTIVQLTCGIPLPIQPATVAGCVIRLDGTIGAPRLVGGYAEAMQRLLDRVRANESIEYDDPDIVGLCRMAMRSSTYLTDELIHAWELLTTADVDAIISAAVA